MKIYILIILLVLFIACVPQEEIGTEAEAETGLPEKPAEVSQEEPIEDVIAEESEPQEEETAVTEENLIEIKERAFYPEEKTIEKNTEIKWVNKDIKIHKIACYIEGERITTSENLQKGDFFTYTFPEEGEYLCVDAIFGLKGTIKVEAQSMLSPTGGAVGTTTGGLGTNLIVTASLSLIAILLYFYARKRKINI